MKLKTIAALCKKSQNIVIMEKPAGGGDRVEQWIGDGYALYPVYGLPYLDEEGVFTIFDVPEKQREKYSFHSGALPEGMRFSDTDRNERIIEDEKISIIAAGRTLKPLQTRGGLVFIDAKYLTPLADMLEVLELYERVKDSGQAYIAAKAGFILVAVIMPYDIVSEEFVKQLQGLTRECAVALHNKQQRKEAAAPDTPQCTFDTIKCDPATGEVIEE